MPMSRPRSLNLMPSGSKNWSPTEYWQSVAQLVKVSLLNRDDRVMIEDHVHWQFELSLGLLM